MSTTALNEDAMLRHALGANEATKRAAPPFALPLLKVGICLMLILVAAAAEVFSATIGFRAAFPTLSDGTTLADAIMPMRYAIAAYLLFGHVVLRAVVGRFGVGINWLFDALGLLALILMLLAMACFQFSGTYGVAGGADDQGSIASMAGPALGVLCGCLMTISFLAAHWLSGRLLKGLPEVHAGWRARRTIAGHQRVIDAVHDALADVTTRAAIIEEMEQPDALAERAAVEAAHEVGLVTARAHELLSQRQLHDGADLADHDEAPMRDVPLSALERRYAALCRYDFAHFFALLRKDTSHA